MVQQKCIAWEVLGSNSTSCQLMSVTYTAGNKLKYIWIVYVHNNHGCKWFRWSQRNHVVHEERMKWFRWLHRAVNFSAHWGAPLPSVTLSRWASAPPSSRPWFSDEAMVLWRGHGSLGWGVRQCPKWGGSSISGSCFWMKVKALTLTTTVKRDLNRKYKALKLPVRLHLRPSWSWASGSVLDSSGQNELPP